MEPARLYVYSLNQVMQLILLYWRWPKHRTLKASVSFPKITTKTLKMTRHYILICHCTSLSPWYIILDKNNFVKVFQKAAQIPTKVHFFQYKQKSWRYSDHEWLRMTNAFILCDLLLKFQKNNAANKEGSFKY